MFSTESMSQLDFLHAVFEACNDQLDLATSPEHYDEAVEHFNMALVVLNEASMTIEHLETCYAMENV